MTNPKYLRHLDTLAAVVVCALLPWLDLPEPHFDDLFYVGAAVELFRGGELVNPWLAGQMFPSLYYFVYPPVHSYVLAGWLKVFGLGVTSMMYFQAACYLAAAIGVKVILARLRVQLGLTFACLLTFLSMVGSGLRPDALGFVFLMGGLAVVGRIPFRRTLGLILFGLCVLAAPRFLAVALALGAFGVVADLRQKDDVEPWARFLWRAVRAYGGPFVLAASVVGLIFLSLIGFRFDEFLELFRLHARARSGSPFHVRSLDNLASWSILIIPMVAAVGLSLWARGSADRMTREARWFVWALIAGLLGMIASGTAIFQMLIFGWLLMLTVILLRERANLKLRCFIERAWCLVFLALWPLIMVNWTADTAALLLGRAHRVSVMTQQKLKSDLLAQSGNRIVVDSGAARYVFGYDVPRNGKDFSFYRPFPGQTPEKLGDRLANEIWCLSRFPARHGHHDIVPDMDGARLLPLESFRYPKAIGEIFVYGGTFGPEGQTLVDTGWKPMHLGLAGNVAGRAPKAK